jgi:TRAP-type transport system periplasmic protein
MSLTRHIFSPSVLETNLDHLNAFSEEEQAWIIQAAAEASRIERDWIRENEEEMLAEIETHMQVEREPDMESFRAAMAPVFEKYEEVFGAELIQAIQNAGQ